MFLLLLIAGNTLSFNDIDSILGSNVDHPAWYLEGFDDGNNKPLRIALVGLPFTVGRRSNCDLTLNSRMVSQAHAEFFLRDKQLWLRDNQSTNGTFINGQKLEGERALQTGDIIHFADLEFRLNESTESTVDLASQTLRISESNIHGAKYRELREMLRLETVQPLFQPIVNLHDSTLLAYEVLGQGFLDSTRAGPGVLFGMAETLGLAVELSELFRKKGCLEAEGLPGHALAGEWELFVNTHPTELTNHTALLNSLTSLRESYPQQRLILEVHESAITDPVTLRSLRNNLEDMGIGVAFDDFGTGQARLLELADVVPRYIKFDGSLIHELHQASGKRQDLVKSLVRLVLDMGIAPIAESIEKPEEAAICLDIGFKYGQGYHFGAPLPSSALS